MKFIDSIFNLLRFNRKNWRAVVLCIFAATVFWLFNALNKTYTANITFPLDFEYDQPYYVAVKPLPDEVRINVTGIGWDLFRRSTGFKVPPLVVPLERPAEVKKIVGSTLPAILSSQMEALQINFVVSDTLYLDVEPKAQRWLTLTLDSVSLLYLHPDYDTAGSVEIVPDSIHVEGPLRFISALEEPFNLSLSDRGIDENYDQEVEVRLPNGELIRRNPPIINVSFDVERIVEVSDTVKLEVVNIPSSANPKIEASGVLVALRMPDHRVASFQWDSLRAVLDLKNFQRGRHVTAPVLQNIPWYATVESIDTIQLSY